MLTYLSLAIIASGQPGDQPGQFTEGGGLKKNRVNKRCVLLLPGLVQGKLYCPEHGHDPLELGHSQDSGDMVLDKSLGLTSIKPILQAVSCYPGSVLTTQTSFLFHFASVQSPIRGE